jgi:shikimate kinase
MRIYLTGFMGSGKSTIGRLLAEKLSLPFVDLDKEIERHLATSIAEVFELHGENHFRDQEETVLKSIDSNRFVMATGGGCFIHNREWMLENGTVIYLDASFTDIVQRIGGDPERPLWKNAEKLYHERQAEYRKAHHTVDARGSEEDVLERITNLLLPEPKKTQES